MQTRRSIACGLMMLIVGSVLLQADPAEAVSRSRKAPYDVGCVGRPPCAVGSDAARKGELHSAGHVSACILYGPPFVLPCWDDESTTAGVNVTKSVTGGITAYAKVRGTHVVGPAPLVPTSACLGLTDAYGHGYAEYGCRPITGGRTTTIATNFEKVTLEPDRYVLYVSLVGVPGSAVVERISYRTTAS
jgi:hypothetical protein